MKRTPIVLAVAIVGLALTAALAPAEAQTQPPARKAYIVQLADAPAAGYDGRIAGLAATRPAPGQRLDAGAQAVQNYLGYLRQQADAVTVQVPAAPVLHRYGVVLNGFSALLTPAEVAKLRAVPGVVQVAEDEALSLNTSTTTSSFLGLGKPGGAWSQFDARGRALQGEDVIVGVLDSGIWPEHSAFADHVDAQGRPVAAGTPGATPAYTPLPAGRFKGICQAGPGFGASACNHKLIGARHYSSGWLAANAFTDFEFHSARDSNGHGSHVASIAAGNQGADAVVAGSPFRISGVAPRARIAAYKVCWSTIEPDGTRYGRCITSDAVAAIDQAVKDGVDVINFSVAGARTTFGDPVSQAFLGAARAGVFVTAGAGNEGPGNEVAHLAPWVASVGNSTHDRYTEAAVTLASGQSFSGPSFQTQGVAAKPLVLATDAGVTPWAQVTNNADALALGRCYTEADRALYGGSTAAVLDPAKVRGKILVCLRGGNALVNKAEAAKAAGAAGLIIQNVSGGLFASANTTLLQPYALPTVHLPNSAESAVLAQAQAGASATMAGSVVLPGVPAPVMNDGSSRGPNRADPGVLKPDLTAPGSLIIGAHVPPELDSALRDTIVAGGPALPGSAMIGGTSMASPHVAGAAALLKQARPDWSPMAIKSALSTSATQSVVLANGSADTHRWGFGAGHLAPQAALATGLVYDLSGNQLKDYNERRIRGIDLNLPSITHADVVGSYATTRTLTHRGTTPVTLTASATLPGFEVTVTPASLSLAPGASASFRVQVRRSNAPFGDYRFGELVWQGGGQSIRSPLTARANAFIGSNFITDGRTAGTRLVTVGTGYDGSLVATPAGLVPARRDTLQVAIAAPGAPVPEVCVPLAVPAGTTAVRAQLFDGDTEDNGNTDLDLLLKNAAGQVVGASGGPTSEEGIEIVAPAAGDYRLCVEGFGNLNGKARVGFVLSSWVLSTLPGAHPGTLRAVAPAQVYSGALANVGLSWSVAAGNRYLGTVVYRMTAGGAVIGNTTLYVDTSVPAYPANGRLAEFTRIKPVR
jgi:subtilisin family serine protease